MRIFISYRRQDSKHIAERINQYLDEHLSGDEVFFDKNWIPEGVPFTQEFIEYIRKSDIFIAIIGPDWVGKRPRLKTPRYRVQQERDYVRNEVKLALDLGIHIIPVLVNEASLPSDNQLPLDILAIKQLQTKIIRSDPYFQNDMRELCVRIRRNLSPLKPSANLTKIYTKQEDAYDELVEYIKRSDIKEAILIQYSSTSSQPIIKELLKKEAKITLYIQSETTAMMIGSQEQSDRITNRCVDLHSVLVPSFGRKFLEESLQVKKYNKPASVNAVRLDNDILLLGWYIYEQVEKSEEQGRYNGDSVEVSGHDIACIVVLKGSEEYASLDRTFNILESNLRANSENVLF